MKVIFLDIDGVLNSAEYDAERTSPYDNIDLSRLPLLKQLIDLTNAKIVLTSSWRKAWDCDKTVCDEIGKQLDAAFATADLEISDKTPVLGRRKDEIASWLAAHPDTEKFVIFDDMSFGWEELSDNLVKTDGMIGRGLEQHHIDKAISILK